MFFVEIILKIIRIVLDVSMALRGRFQYLLNNSQLLKCQFVRWKGHSKWQNIRHTKGAKDLAYSKLCMKYSLIISRSINENGNETDPLLNKVLQK